MMMKTQSNIQLTLLRIVFYLCALYFFILGLALITVPHLITRSAGHQNPIVFGMLRGAGGSIIPYSLLYVLAAQKPRQRVWALTVIALANVLAIALDIASVWRGEYALDQAMLDLPIEALSLTVIIVFLWGKRITGGVG